MILGLLAVLVIGVGSLQADSCLHYEPESVRLEGILFYELNYGPPNYGENPETDQKGYYPMLRLPQPVTVCGDPNSELNAETERAIREIQLVFENRHVPPRENGERPVVVTGTLYHSHTGHHYRPVLIRIDRFEFDDSGVKEELSGSGARLTAPNI